MPEQELEEEWQEWTRLKIIEIAKLYAVQEAEGLVEACEELCNQTFVDGTRTSFIIPPAFEKAVRLSKAALQHHKEINNG